MCVCECVCVLCVWCEHTRIYVWMAGPHVWMAGPHVWMAGPHVWMAISFGTHCGSRHGTTIQRHGRFANRMTLAAWIRVASEKKGFSQ